MAQKNYIFAVARVRAKETSLLNNAYLEQLLAAKSYDDCMRMLREKGWGDDRTATAEAMLAAETRKTWEFINDVVPDRHAFDVFRLSADFHNLKAAIKQACIDGEVPDIFTEGGTIPASEIMNKVRLGQFNLLPDGMASIAETAYTEFLQTRDSQKCDFIIDKACLEAISARGRSEQNEALKLYAENTVACADVKIAVRACKTRKPYRVILESLAPCDTLNIDSLARAAADSLDTLCTYLQNTAFADAAELIKESPSAFECRCDNVLMNRLKSQQHESFTIGPLAAYILARESEIKSVRLILSAKRNSLPAEAVRERLRDCYV